MKGLLLFLTGSALLIASIAMSTSHNRPLAVVLSIISLVIAARGLMKD